MLEYSQICEWQSKLENLKHYQLFKMNASTNLRFRLWFSFNLFGWKVYNQLYFWIKLHSWTNFIFGKHSKNIEWAKYRCHSRVLFRIPLLVLSNEFNGSCIIKKLPNAKLPNSQCQQLLTSKRVQKKIERKKSVWVVSILG